jgi:hypothetical protein
MTAKSATTATNPAREGTDLRRPIAANLEMVCPLPKDPDDSAVAAFRRAVDVKAFELFVVRIMLAQQTAAEMETEHDVTAA